MPPRSYIHSFQTLSSGQPNNGRDAVFFTPDGQNTPIFTTKTLIVPIVSTANVPQLAVDILIASLSLHRLGIFDPKYLVPVVGAREGGMHGVTTPLELFGREDIDFVIVQQRSPVLKAHKDKFTSALFKFVQDYGFKSLLFLSGVDPTNRTDSQMLTPIYHLIPPGSPTLEGSPLVSLISLPKYTSTSATEDKIPSMPGGGLTRRLISSIPEGWSISTGLLIIFALEGDNRQDARLMANVVVKILGADERIKEWKEPESWKHGLFGTPNDQTLFG